MTGVQTCALPIFPSHDMRTVSGIAVMQLLVEKQSISKNTIIEMIQVLWQGDQVGLAVELALDVLMLREE